MLIRNDGNAYPTGYDALKADLDELGAAYAERPYSASVASDFDSEGFKVAIWYRGGPQASGETVPYTTAWTAAEIDNYLRLMNDGHQVLLVSQSHGYQNSTTPLPYGWQVYYGCTNRPASVPGGQERHPWAASLALELGIGLYGGDYFPSAPTNLTGLIANGMFGPDSAAATGERYDGAGSSTKLPITFELSTSGTQYCGIGYWSPWMGGWASGPYFRGGMAASPAFLGYNLGYLSWGNLQAPDSNIGFFPNYTHTSGPGKLWIIGYPYSKLRVLSAAGGATMTRAEVLKNMLGWLNSGLVWGAGPSVAYDEYTGPPEILQVMPGWWEAGAFNTGAAAQVWNGTTGTYPDQSSSNVYRTTDPGTGNYVVTTTPNNDWINGNDVDFQFPWYAYVVDVDGDGVEVGDGNNDDDTVTFGGLLLEDPDANWVRDTSFGYYGNTGGDPVPSAVIDSFLPPVVVAGYYVSTTTGDTGDEVRASYGSSAVSLTWDNENELAVETIAHWPAGFTPGQLYWSMYPGQDMLDPYNYPAIIGSDATWDTFRASFDIDPSVAITERDTPANAGQIQWNRAQFMYSDAPSAGRTVYFNYRNIPNWNGDLNRDGVADMNDKFPIRCRLFTDLNDMIAWSGTWPNHMYNPGSEPGPSWPTDPPGGDDGDFIEGGCYVVDTGDPNYPLTIMDDPTQPDPGEGSYNWTSWNHYTVQLYFGVSFGALNYQSIEFDYNYDVVNGFNYNGTAVDITSSVTPALDHWGWFYGEAPIIVPTDPFTGYMALRVTDNVGDTDVYWYPAQQQLSPVINTAILDDPQSQSPPDSTYNRDIQKLFDDLELLYGVGRVDVIDLNSNLTNGQLDGYNLIVWTSDQTQQYGNYPQYGYTPGTSDANINEVKRAHEVNGASVFVVGNSAHAKAGWAPYYNPQWRTITPYIQGSGYVPVYGGYYEASTQLVGNNALLPNNLPGVNLQAKASPISGAPHGYFVYYGGTPSPYWRSQNDGVNYPFNGGAGVNWNVRAEYNSYDWYFCGLFARRATGNRGDLISVAVNYGDLAKYQGYNLGTIHRAAVLENILSCRDNNSMFNATVTSWPTPTPSTIIFGTNLDGNLVAPFVGKTWPNWYTANLGGQYGDSWTMLNAGASPRYFGPFMSAGNNAYTYDIYMPGHTYGYYGNNNNKVLYAGPFNFTAESDDPVIYLRIYKYTETYWDRMWIGWDQQSSGPILEGRQSYSQGPSTWNYFAELDANVGSAAQPALMGWTLNGAAGQNNVYLGVIFSSDGSVDWYYGTTLDSFAICRQDGDTGPVGL